MLEVHLTHCTSLPNETKGCQMLVSETVKHQFCSESVLALLKIVSVAYITAKQISCFGKFTQLFFWNTQLFFEQGVQKSQGIIEYPIKSVDVSNVLLKI